MELKIAIVVIWVVTMAVLWGTYVVVHSRTAGKEYKDFCSYGERKDNEG